MWQLNVNLMGVNRTTKAVLPIMRKNKSGHIVNISSVGGLDGQTFNEIYSATKLGVEGYTEALASYVQLHFNIKFTSIETGGIHSEFTKSPLAQFEVSGGMADAEYKPLLEAYIGRASSRQGNYAY
ncbi:hypothetical protein ASG66_02730 [Bacillus sp. Leaf406]|nr:hypothetical protein ASG66_02730 [Bacillus sp. Leaf406]